MEKDQLEMPVPISGSSPPVEVEGRRETMGFIPFHCSYKPGLPN